MERCEQMEPVCVSKEAARVGGEKEEEERVAVTYAKAMASILAFSSAGISVFHDL